MNTQTHRKGVPPVSELQRRSTCSSFVLISFFPVSSLLTSRQDRSIARAQKMASVAPFSRRQWASQSLRVTAKELSIVSTRGKNNAIAERFSK